MQASHSRVECFESCPYKYKMRYIDKVKTLPPDNADNALILGTAVHTGIEKGIDAALKEYYLSYPIIDDLHINESMKLEYLLPKVIDVLPKGIYETKITDSDFIGFTDLLVPVGDNEDDLYDFKYSNNVSNYMGSKQLHIYKYFREKTSPRKIRNMYYVFVPKVQIKQKKTENLFQFRQRIMEELEKKKVKIVPIEFDYTKVIDFTLGIKKLLEAKEFKKNHSYLCNWCEYQKYCENGVDYMLLPKNERRKIGETQKRKIWIYGASFSGKTTMLDKSPEPLNLNTDGNIQFVTMPYIAIKDEVKVEGRQTKRTFAWEVFKNTIEELEKKQNDFKTIIVDLLEDTREMCRIFKYSEMGIQHESDSGYGKGWDIIKTEYLSTIRRLFNLDYENIVVISHEDVSKDITKKNGQNITRISPNIQDAISNKVAGMVDIVARVVAEDDGRRTLNFKSDEVTFGGGRLKGIKSTCIPLSWEALMKVYSEANETIESPTEESKAATTTRKGRTKKTEVIEEAKDVPEEITESKEVDSSAQKVQEVEPNEVAIEQTELVEQVTKPVEETEAPKEDVPPVEEPEKEKPKTRTRKKRGE